MRNSQINFIYRPLGGGQISSTHSRLFCRRTRLFSFPCVDVSILRVMLYQYILRIWLVPRIPDHMTSNQQHTRNTRNIFDKLADHLNRLQPVCYFYKLNVMFSNESYSIC